MFISRKKEFLFASKKEECHLRTLKHAALAAGSLAGHA